MFLQSCHSLIAILFLSHSALLLRLVHVRVPHFHCFHPSMFSSNRTGVPYLKLSICAAMAMFRLVFYWTGSLLGSIMHDDWWPELGSKPTAQAAGSPSRQRRDTAQGILMRERAGRAHGNIPRISVISLPADTLARGSLTPQKSSVGPRVWFPCKIFRKIFLALDY